MSDTKLRDLERRWKETDTVDDEAAYLLERVRVGDLSRERLELAAYLGHPAAGLTMGGAKPGWADGHDLRSWLRGLLLWRCAVVLMVYMAALRLLAVVLMVYMAALRLLTAGRSRSRRSRERGQGDWLSAGCRRLLERPCAECR